MQKVSKEQIEVIEKVLQRYNGNKAKAAMNFQPRAGLTVEKFTQCMIEGYELAKPKEDLVRELYNNYNRQGAARSIIRKVLAVLEIEVEGVTDEKQN